MFDNTPNQPNSPEPEDILAPLDGQIQPGEIKSALANQKLKPVASEPTAAPEPPTAPPSLEAGAEISPPLLSKKGLYLALAIVAVVALGAGTAWVLLRLPKTSKLENLPSTTEVPPLPAVVPEIAPVQLAPALPAGPPAGGTPPAPVDSDGDGLTDEEETARGTNPQVADTDGDGLTDYEEIMIWKTDPLKADTDGDTFSDGTEVKNGYNPNGEGKLMEIPK